MAASEGGHDVCWQSESSYAQWGLETLDPETISSQGQVFSRFIFEPREIPFHSMAGPDPAIQGHANYQAALERGRKNGPLPNPYSPNPKTEVRCRDRLAVGRRARTSADAGKHSARVLARSPQAAGLRAVA